MNNVCLLGRLTRDPELRYTPQGGVAVVRFTLAVNRRLGKEKRQEIESNHGQTADFISCTAWRQTAELIANYCHQGDQIAVEGRIQTGSYEKDGRRIYTTDVVVNTMDFASRAGGRGWIRTTEAESSRFTVCPHWPLGNTPIFSCCASVRRTTCLF